MVDRRFWIAEGRQFDFEEAFGRDGPWCTMLYGANGYSLTESWCESEKDRVYRVRDLWSWHREFEVFRSRFHAEVDRFELWLRSEGVIEREQFLGAYYEKFEGGSDEDLVLS